MRSSATRLSALDFTPRSIELAERLDPLWSARIPYQSGRTRLASHGSSLVLVEPEHGVSQVSPIPPRGERLAGWERYDFPLATLGAGASSPAVLVDDRGGVFRWAPGSPPRLTWTSDVPPSSLIVLGLPDDDLLVQWERAGRWKLARIHGPSNRTHWEISGCAPLALPHEDALFLEMSDAPHVVVALDARTGRRRWSTKPVDGGLGSIIGVVGPSLWVTTRSGRLRSFGVEDGLPGSEAVLESVKLPMGVLDEQGLFHVCTGYDIQVVDLAGEGRIVVERIGFEPGTTRAPRADAFGRLALTTTDGRLIYHDECGRIFAVTATDRAHPRLIWEGNARIAMVGGASGALFALGTDGVVRAFGEAGASVRS